MSVSTRPVQENENHWVGELHFPTALRDETDTMALQKVVYASLSSLICRNASLMDYNIIT